MKPGRICCGFPPKSVEISEIGTLLRRWAEMGHPPKFEFSEAGRLVHSKSSLILAQEDLNLMIKESKFPHIYVKVRLSYNRSETEMRLSFQDRNNSVYPISGFPRCLDDDEVDSMGGE